MLNNKVLHFIFTIFCFLAFNSLFAQTPNFKNFKVKDGLPSSECYQVLQDKKGYIWVATDKGVVKYDGVKFKTFTKEDGLPENCIIRMYEDPMGRIWFGGVTNHIAYFQNNKITCLKINSELSRIENHGLINSFAFSENTLWIGLYGTDKIYKIIFAKKGKNNNSLKHQKLHEINKIEKIHGCFLFNFKNGEYFQGWIHHYFSEINIKSRSLVMYNGSKRYFYLDLFQKLQTNKNIRSIKINKNHFLLSYGNQLIKLNSTNGKIVYNKQINEFINYLFSDSKNGLWAGANDKGLIYYPTGEIGNSNEITFLKNSIISGITEDHEHGIWISTLDDGLFYLKDINFKHKTELSSETVNCIAYKNNTIIAGLDNGNIVFGRNGKFTEIINTPNPILINFIRKISSDSPNSITISGSQGFCIMDLNSKKSKWIKANYFSNLQDISTVAFVKKKGENHTYFLATHGRIIIVKNTNKEKNTSKLINLRLRLHSIAEDDFGHIWLGTNQGLYCYDYNKFVFKGKNSIPLSHRINDIQIKNNTIWMSTKDNGICIKKGIKNYEISTKNGLSSNICQSIYLESDKIGWIATNKGICKITIKSWKPLSFKIKKYNTTNGLISNEINQITKDKNNIYIAANGGISTFDETKVKVNNTPPPIHINSIQINKGDTSILKNYNLPYFKNNFSISFIGLSYKSEGDVEYKYKLIGLDTNWNYTQNPKIQFTTLPFGKYSFLVSAKNNDGYWSEKPAKIDFTISPPFWHTWTFRIIAGISFLATIYFFIKWRINKVEKRALENSRLYQQTIEMEMKFLSSQMNPHFTFNAMNSIQYYMLENEPEKAQKYLVKYSKLIRKVLENNMKKYVPISEEIEMLGLYMDIESVRFKIQFKYEIQISNEIKAMNVSIPPMIVQPYIENAIWHGISHKKEIQGKIIVSYELFENKIKCSIEDNGIGRKKSKELNTGKTNKESLGMLITHQRLQQLHSESEMDIEPEIIDLLDECMDGCGTKIVIYLPFVNG